MNTMQDRIQTQFDEKINGYVVSMPEHISLEAIEEWKQSISSCLESLSKGQQVVLLVDTNMHQFESIQCLQGIRGVFVTNPVIQSNGVTVAFVQPYEYMKPHIKSENEAYFDDCSTAFKWLQEKIV